MLKRLVQWTSVILLVVGVTVEFGDFELALDCRPTSVILAVEPGGSGGGGGGGIPIQGTLLAVEPGGSGGGSGGGIPIQGMYFA